MKSELDIILWKLIICVDYNIVGVQIKQLAIYSGKIEYWNFTPDPKTTIETKWALKHKCLQMVIPVSISGFIPYTRISIF